MSTAAEARLAFVTAALLDPDTLTPSSFDGIYDRGALWDDWTPEGEIEFIRNGRHGASRPFTVERITTNGEHEATAILLGADEKRWSVTCWVNETEPHLVHGMRTIPAPPEGLDIRLASVDDGPVLGELERRAPLRLGEGPLTFMTFDHGDDYFAPSRLMEEVTIYVGETDGKVCGVYCGAVQPVEVDGEPKRLFLEHHVRIDPDVPRGGVFWALCAFGRDAYARSSDSIAFYVSPDNLAVRKFVSGVPPWSVQPLRALLPCRVDPSVEDVGRFATSDDAGAIIGALDGAHRRSALYAPYTEASLGARLSRDAAQYTWGDIRVLGGAAVGVGHALVGVTKECEGRTQVTSRAVALDHGFAPGGDDDYATLLRWWCSHLATTGATHVAVFTSERSATYEVVMSLAEEIEPFDFWAFNIAEPKALAERGFYVDPVYF